MCVQSCISSVWRWEGYRSSEDWKGKSVRIAFLVWVSRCMWEMVAKVPNSSACSAHSNTRKKVPHWCLRSIVLDFCRLQRRSVGRGRKLAKPKCWSAVGLRFIRDTENSHLASFKALQRCCSALWLLTIWENNKNCQWWGAFIGQ